MNILVANLGSTSYKYRLFAVDEAGETLVAKGGFERVNDHGEAISQGMAELKEAGHLKEADDLHAVGFKTVLGKELTGCVEADERVLEALEGFAPVAPAHNPPYAQGIRSFRERLPHVTRVALFETAFYQWMPTEASLYGVPEQWRAIGVRRYGFHGASHKFIAERSAELSGRQDVAAIAKGLYQSGHRDPDGEPFRVVSCHLGGSSSVTGILNGRAIGSSMGFSPQSGLPQNNRVGDLDSGALPYVMRTLGLDLDEAERQMTKEGGLLGVSGLSNDLRDIKEAAENGNHNAQAALNLLIHQCRHWIGAFAFQMGGCDAVVFTAGIGENHPWLRKRILEGLESYGIRIDETRNNNLHGEEGRIGADDATTAVYLIPANEELVVAREVYRFMQARG